MLGVVGEGIGEGAEVGVGREGEERPKPFQRIKAERKEAAGGSEKDSEGVDIESGVLGHVASLKDRPVEDASVKVGEEMDETKRGEKALAAEKVESVRPKPMPTEVAELREGRES